MVDEVLSQHAEIGQFVVMIDAAFVDLPEVGLLPGHGAEAGIDNESAVEIQRRGPSAEGEVEVVIGPEALLGGFDEMGGDGVDQFIGVSHDDASAAQGSGGFAHLGDVHLGGVHAASQIGLNVEYISPEPWSVKRGLRGCASRRSRR